MTGAAGRSRDEVRSRILRAGLQLFDERGFDAVTVEQIAAASAVSAMSVYRHFGSKHALVFDTRLEASRQLGDIARAGPSSPDPRQCVVAALRRLSEVQVDQELYELRARIVRASPTLQRLSLGARSEFEQALVAGLQARGVPASEWHLRVTAAAGLAAFHEAVRRWRDNGDPPLPQATEEALALLWPDVVHG